MSKPAQRSESELLFQMIKNRYGHLLKPEQLEEVRSQVELALCTSEEMKAVKLSETDSPAIGFRPYRAKR
ncbi:MAG: hypothetical protein FJ312_00145 [SAR202 cluster bacterium]|nr:hypothetical protein [SAR202 cluster bacterium]